MKYINKATRVLLVGVLVALSVVSYAPLKLEASQNGPTGDYADRVDDMFVREPGDVLDPAGTRFNLVRDLYRRMFQAIDVPTNQLTVAPSSGTPSPSNAASPAHGNGWTLAIPTGAVDVSRIATRVYNPRTNTLNFHVGIASITTGGALALPTTNQYIKTIVPGDEYELKTTTGSHLVLVTTSAVTGESVRAWDYK